MTHTTVDYACNFYSTKFSRFLCQVHGAWVPTEQISSNVSCLLVFTQQFTNKCEEMKTDNYQMLRTLKMIIL